MNVRMLPPIAVISQSITVNGRSYSAAPGVVVDVPDFDAAPLSANGWIRIAWSGQTSSRPSANQATTPFASPGTHFFDATLNKLIVFDGATWRDPSSGAAV